MDEEVGEEGEREDFGDVCAEVFMDVADESGCCGGGGCDEDCSSQIEFACEEEEEVCEEGEADADDERADEVVFCEVEDCSCELGWGGFFRFGCIV